MVHLAVALYVELENTWMKVRTNTIPVKTATPGCSRMEMVNPRASPAHRDRKRPGMAIPGVLIALKGSSKAHMLRAAARRVLQGRSNQARGKAAAIIAAQGSSKTAINNRNARTVEPGSIRTKPLKVSAKTVKKASIRVRKGKTAALPVQLVSSKAP